LMGCIMAFGFNKKKKKSTWHSFSKVFLIYT